MLQALQSDEIGISLQVDMVRDFGPQYGQSQVIGTNKITAILGRTDSKALDLYFICRPDTILRNSSPRLSRDLGLLEFYKCLAPCKLRK